MKVGLMQCKDAILNAVGPNTKGFDKEIITKMIKEQEKKSQKQKKERSWTSYELVSNNEFKNFYKLELLVPKRHFVLVRILAELHHLYKCYSQSKKPLIAPFVYYSLLIYTISEHSKLVKH